MRLTPQANGLIDLERGDGGIAIEDGLQTAVLISLLTDRRARQDDRLPYEAPAPGQPIPPDRRGWCGDGLSEIEDDRIGSRLWLLNREKQTEETRRRAIFYAEEALQWIIDDGHATAADITAEWQESGRLALYVAITLPNGTRLKSVIPTGVGAYAV